MDLKERMKLMNQTGTISGVPTRVSTPARASTQAPENFSPASRVASAQFSQRNPLFISGVYPLLYLNYMRMGKSKNGIDMFSASFDILESEVAERPIGTSCDYMIVYNYPDSAARDTKIFMSILENVDSSELTQENIEYMWGPDNPSRGRLIKLHAYLKKPNDIWPKTNWYPIGDDIQAKSEELHTNVYMPF